MTGETSIRRLHAEDLPAVTSLCTTLWQNDYVPDEFATWTDSQVHFPFGAFTGEELIGMGMLLVDRANDCGWIRALRVHPAYQNRGVGTAIVRHLVDVAAGVRVSLLRYGTSSKNLQSLRVATKTGFSPHVSVGYARFQRPFPARPSPSPNIHPLEVDVERVLQLVRDHPELVPTDVVPFLWEFEPLDENGLRTIAMRSTLHVVFAESGEPVALYYTTPRDRRGALTLVYGVYATDRSTFVDLMARLLHSAESEGAEYAVFFMGPRATEWAQHLGYVPEEYLDRRYVLLERRLQK